MTVLNKEDFCINVMNDLSFTGTSFSALTKTLHITYYIYENNIHHYCSLCVAVLGQSGFRCSPVVVLPVCVYNL